MTLVSRFQSLAGLVQDGLVPLFVIAALYGLYFILFWLAVWTSYQLETRNAVRMRLAAILMFCTVTAYTPLPFISWIIRTSNDRSGILDTMSYPIQALDLAQSVLTCIASLLSDGMLAWRCWVIFHRRRWLKRLLITLLTVFFLTGLASIVPFIPYFSMSSGNQTEQNWIQAQEMLFRRYALLSAWGWLMFLLNSVMTASIFGSIGYRALKGREDGSISMSDSSRYVGVLWAIVESSFVSWVGLVAFGVTDAIHWINTTPGPSGIANLEGEAYWNGTFTVLPLFFAISQSLIIARVGLKQAISPDAQSSKKALISIDTPYTSGGSSLGRLNRRGSHDTEAGLSAAFKSEQSSSVAGHPLGA